jgi:hypothetical protein
MYLTVRDALDNLLLDVGEQGDALARAVALSLLNEAVYEVWDAHPWFDYTSPSPLSLTLTAGSSRYSLPNHVGRVLDPVENRTRKGAPLASADPVLAAELYPGMGTTDAPVGPPRHWRLSGSTGVYQQPATTGNALEVVSSSAADTNVTVTLRGDDSDGASRTVRATLTGTTPVALGTFTWVDEFGKATIDSVTPTAGQSSAGTVTLRKTTDGTVLQALDKYEAAREHKILQLYPTPDAADVIALPIMRTPNVLVSGSDAIPSGWWKAIKEAWGIAYAKNTGVLARDATPPRPFLNKMIEADNMQRTRPIVRAFHL